MLVIIFKKKGANIMKNILFTFILTFTIVGYSYSDDVTMKYGGDWVNTTVIQNGDFMSMSGSFVGTNVMKMGDSEIRTNFKCTGLYQTAPAAILVGSCNMKEAGTQDYWVLNWQCTVTGTGKEDCKGKAIGGTGKFKKVSGSMEWIDIAGFGEGKGTFKLN